MVPVLLIVSMVAFGLLYVLPGDPAVAMLGENAGNRQTYLALRRDLGLDQPVYVQYLTWLGRVLSGDLGHSIRTNEPVSSVLMQRVPISLYLGTAGLVVGLALGLSVALASALRPGSRIDSMGTLLAMGGVAIPSFWQALLLVYVFAVVLRWLPPSGFTSPFTDPLLSVRMLILPAIVLGTHSAAVIMRQGRSALMEVLEQDYITTARSKGLADGSVVAGHAMNIRIRNGITVQITSTVAFSYPAFRYFTRMASRSAARLATTNGRPGCSRRPSTSADSMIAVLPVTFTDCTMAFEGTSTRRMTEVADSDAVTEAM